MENTDIRWKQRYKNFEDALSFLNEAVNKGHLSELEKAGVVQSFEFTFELAWKTMKDYLNNKGVSVIYPKDVIKEAFQSGLLTHGDTWMDMLDSRNLMSHTYRSVDSEFVFNEIITKYVDEMNTLLHILTKDL